MPCWSWRVSRILAAGSALLLATAGVARGQAPSEHADATARLRRGFLALEARTPDGRRDEIDRALNEFDWARSERPDWPWPRFGLALARLAAHEGGFMPKPGLGGQLTGESYYESFVRGIGAALERDSLFEPALDFLVPFLASQGERSQPDVFIRAIRRAAALPGARADAYLVLGRALRREARYEAALDAFRTYRSAGGPAGTAQLELARTLAGAGDVDAAAEAYLAGAAHDDSLTHDVYRSDLAWIAGSSELAAFDSIGPAERGAWLRDYFRVRDAESIRLPGERLQEHLRRWAHVHRHFQIPNPARWSRFVHVRVPGPAPCTRGMPQGIDRATLAFDPDRLDDARHEEGVLDHRAVVYMRHGEPASRIPIGGLLADTAIRLVAAASEEVVESIPPDPYKAEASEVWVYWFAGRARVFTFAPSLGSRFGGRVIQLSPPAYAPVYWALADVDQLYRRAARRLSGYENRRSSIRLACLPTMQDLAIRAEADVITGANSDSYTLVFSSSLDPVLSASAIGTDAKGGARVLLVFAVAGTRLVPETDPAGGVRYSIGLRVTAIDSSSGVIRTLDTLRTFRAADTLGASAHLSGYLELPLPAGRYDVRAAVIAPGGEAGGMRLWEDVRVGAPGPGPVLSDIVLERETDGLRWANRGDPVMLNPLDAYQAGMSAPIYYELSGLVAGRAYRTTLSLRELDEDDDDAIKLLFTETADGGEAHVRRTIALEGLKRGQYRLVVSVEDAITGEKDSRERLLNVVR